MNDLKNFNIEMANVVGWLNKELSGIRTGRATATLLDSVFVEVYGSKMPVNQLASISQEDPKTIKIMPFDFKQSSIIEKGINEANLGVSVSNSSTGIRVIFPDLTSERRDILVKQVGKKVEEAKTSVRVKRDELKKEIQNSKKAGSISEDDERRQLSEMQEMVDKTNKEFDTLFEKKEKEIKN